METPQRESEQVAQSESEDASTLTGRRIVLAGGGGFLGRSLTSHLSRRGADVVVLSRSPREISGAEVVRWDGRTAGDWSQVLEGAAGVVNLAGRSVDCIKTPDHCDEILRSRVESTQAIGAALEQCATAPPVWVQMSTAHIYGDPPAARCDENSALGYGLAPTVGKAWEEAFHESKPREARGVVLRTSFVIGRGGGALSRLSLLAKAGLGGTVGHGRQGMSWIHEHDLNRIFERALLDESMNGTYIASSPSPVSNRVFMRALRRAHRIPIGLPAPSWMVRIGAPLVMRTDPELAIYGRNVLPTRLASEGFQFEHAELGEALRDLVGR